MVIQADHREQNTSGVIYEHGHLDELRVATASSLPLNGLAPAPVQGTTPRSRPFPINAA
jgi:hypothetical protein